MNRTRLRRIERVLADAETVPLKPEVRALVLECRALCTAYVEVWELAVMRAELIRKYAKANERLVEQNTAMADQLERYERRRAAS